MVSSEDYTAAQSVFLRHQVMLAAPLKAEEMPKPPTSSLDLARRFRPFSHKVPDFHEVWYEAFDDPETPFILLLAPRSSAKTSCVLTAAEYRVITNRQARVGIVSKSEELATAFLREMKRDFTTNERLIAAVGKLKPDRPLKWNDSAIVLQGADLGKDVNVAALGVGGQMAGRRFDHLILDDVEGVATVVTEHQRAQTREWFAREAMPTLVPGGTIWVVGTRYHEDDLYGFLLKEGQELLESVPVKAVA